MMCSLRRVAGDVSLPMQPGIMRNLYYEMLRIRMVEERIADLYPEQEMRCPVHLCIGQEAIAVGVCAQLHGSDYVLGGHRSHGHYLAKGGDLKRMIAELYGKAAGCCGGRGGSMHLVDLKVGFLAAAPIVASTIPIAVGVAFGKMLQGRTALTSIFFGEGATEEGVFHEAVNFAALHRLPVLFVCENNSYSVYSPLSVRQPAGREVVSLARGHGINCRQGDGNDVIEVYDIAGAAIADIRNGRGPAFLEFKTARWREHCGPYYDNELGYRSKQEVESCIERCPLATFKSRCDSEGILSPEDYQQMAQRIESEIVEAVTCAKLSPFPEDEDLLQQVFCPGSTDDVASHV